MPYKDPINRREAWKRWAKKHRNEVKAKENARKQAQTSFPSSLPCSIKQCNKQGERHHSDYSKPKDIIWLCKRHHELIHHQKVRLCNMSRCDRKHWAKGMCHKHLKQWNPEKYK
jgi:hypothetical protein